jgi:hypothetical protein
MPKSQESLLEFLQKRANTLPEEVVTVPEWGRDIVLQGMSARERDEFEASNLKRAQAKSGNGAGRRRGANVEPDLANFRARLVARHIVEQGQRPFANAQGEEILGEQPAAILDRLFTVAQRLSGFSAEDIQALEGNSDATDADDLSSDLPESSAAPSPN